MSRELEPTALEGVVIDPQPETVIVHWWGIDPGAPGPSVHCVIEGDTVYVPNYGDSPNGQ